jgi:hypothetical protein
MTRTTFQRFFFIWVTPEISKRLLYQRIVIAELIIIAQRSVEKANVTSVFSMCGVGVS